MTIDRLSSQSNTTMIDNMYIEKVNRISAKKNEDPQFPNKQEQKESKSLSKVELNEIVNGMNQFLQPSHTSLRFELHEKLQEYFVKIVDDKTHEVIREIPSEKLLDMYAAMTEFLGLVVDKKI